MNIKHKHYEVTYKVNGLIVKILKVSYSKDDVIYDFKRFEPHCTLLHVCEVDKCYRNPEWNWNE